MNFGEAIDLLKRGKRVARAGWNGKGMFLFINFGSTDYSKPMAPDIGGVSTMLFEAGDRGTGTRMPNINMRAADGSIVTGWLASQTDILAEDWKELVTFDLSFDVLLDPNDGEQMIQLDLLVSHEDDREDPAQESDDEGYFTKGIDPGYKGPSSSVNLEADNFAVGIQPCDNPDCICHLLAGKTAGNA